MRTWRISLLLIFLAGCTQSSGEHSRVPLDPGLPPLEWKTALNGDLVEVILYDLKSYYHVDQIDLLGPDGRVYRATEITRRVHDDDSYGTGARFGVGAGSGGGGVSTGIGLSFPIGGNRSSRDHTQTETAILLQNPDFYRATTDQWKVRVTLTDKTGEQSTADFPAPVN